MKIIYVKSKTPVEKIQAIGRQIKTSGKLNKEDVQILDKKKVLDLWNKVGKRYS